MLNIAEVFEIAEQIERNGYNFYKKASETLRDGSAKDFLLQLAEMELDHENFFGRLKEKMKVDSSEFSDVDDVALAYLHAMVDGEVFQNISPPADKIMGNESIVDLIKMAMDFEKNTIVYFNFVKKILSNADDLKKVDALIEEEIGHLTMLTAKKNELTNEG